MSVNLGGGLPPVPGNPPDPNAPPAPPVAPPVNGPAMSVPVPAASPFPAPSSSGSDFRSSEPEFAEQEAPPDQYQRHRLDWESVGDALRCGDAAFAHRMLDQGLLPYMVEKYESGESVCCCVPWGGLRDIELIDRIIDLSVRQGIQSDLYGGAIESGNGVLLLRLVKGAVDGWQKVPEHLERMLARSLQKNEADQLESLIRLWKEHCPTCKIDWNRVLEPLRNCPSMDVMKILTRELRPDRLSEDTLTGMYLLAFRSRQVTVITCLCEWMAEDLEKFAQSANWRAFQKNLYTGHLITLASGGFPVGLEVFPSPDHDLAQEFQLALFGPKLAKGAFAKMAHAASGSSAEVTKFIYDCVRGNSNKWMGGRRPRPASATDIARALFQNGLTPSLSVKLAEALAKHLDPATRRIFGHRNDLRFLACLNECINMDSDEPSLDPLSLDPLSREQAEAICSALQDAIDERFGGPVAFFSWSILCIRIDGNIDFDNFSRAYQTTIGLSNALCRQFHTTLETAIAEVMASPVPVSLLRPGTTGIQLQSAFHEWMRRGVAQRIILRLPQDLGIAVAKDDGENSSGSGSDADAVWELVAPANYLARTVIRQYSDIFAKDIKGSVDAIMAICSSSPVDVFVQLNNVDIDEDSSGSGSSYDPDGHDTVSSDRDEGSDVESEGEPGQDESSGDE